MVEDKLISISMCCKEFLKGRTMGSIMAVISTWSERTKSVSNNTDDVGERVQAVQVRDHI